MSRVAYSVVRRDYSDFEILAVTDDALKAALEAEKHSHQCPNCKGKGIIVPDPVDVAERKFNEMQQRLRDGTAICTTALCAPTPGYEIFDRNSYSEKPHPCWKCNGEGKVNDVIVEEHEWL